MAINGRSKLALGGGTKAWHCLGRAGLLAILVLCGAACITLVAAGEAGSPGAPTATLGSPAGSAPGAASGDPTYADRIITQGSGPLAPTFIPQAVLAQTAIEDLPLSPQQLEYLRWKLGLRGAPDKRLESLNRETWLREMRAKHAEPIRDCEVPSSIFRKKPTSAGRSENLLEYIQDADLAFVGTVVAVVDGWSARESAPYQAVYLRAVEVIKDRHHEVPADGVLPFLRQGGSVEIAGLRLCAERQSASEPAQVGDSVLVGGVVPSADLGLLYETFVFLVRDGQITPNDTYVVSDPLPLPLRSFLADHADDFLAPWQRAIP